MDLGLTGRVAIVATASKGLRRAVAEEFAREGARVGICARTASTLAETAAHIQKTTGGEVFYQALDVIDFATVMLPIQVVLRLTCLGTPAGSVARCCRPRASDVHRLFWPGKLLRKCQRESGDI